MGQDLSGAVVTDHARQQMVRRGIREDHVRTVLSNPNGIQAVGLSRIVAHGFVSIGSPAVKYLLRVFVDTDCQPAVVVTVYRTSKIGKYRIEP